MRLTSRWTANTTISNDFRDAVVRDLLIGTGPVGDGQGMAINVPGAYLTVDPLIRKIDGEIVQQSLTYAASRFGGDAGTGARGAHPPDRARSLMGFIFATSAEYTVEVVSTVDPAIEATEEAKVEYLTTAMSLSSEYKRRDQIQAPCSHRKLAKKPR